MRIIILRLFMLYFKATSYLKFLAKSTNAHGIHSPFVFAYATQCLYASPKMAKDTAVNVLLKSIGYCGAKTIQIQEPLSVIQHVKKQYPNLVWKANCFDMLYMDDLTPKALNALLSEGKLHNDSMLLVPAIYRSPESQKNWQALIALPEITVSLDLFHVGIVCLRKEQVKEHFTIRV